MTRTLASEIGSSLNPVREALARLAAEGVVDRVPGAGAFVRTPDWQELDDLYDFRESVEPHAASRAARFITDAEIGHLLRICDEELEIARALRSTPEGYATGKMLDRWVDLEEQFHELVYRAARNRFTIQAVSGSRLLSRMFVQHRNLKQLVSISITARTWRQHRRLVRALSSGNRDAAAQLVLEQIQRGRKHIIATMRDQEQSDAGTR